MRSNFFARLHRAAVTSALFLVLPVGGGAAQSAQPLSKDIIAARVDSMVRAYMVAKAPAGMSVAISRGKEILVDGAWGVSDVRNMRPVTTNSVYQIGSVTKQFTAVLLLRQVERGRLGLTDSIGRYLTAGLRPEWGALTIEHLLNHTAGTPRDHKREGQPYEEVSTATMISWAAQDTMLFAPGTRHYYSNTGYLLLGALVEKLYGKPYSEVLHEEIARPLGLRTLRWCRDPAKDTAMTTGHQYHGPGKHEALPFAHPSRQLAGGGICSSAADLAAWNRALHGGRVVSPDSYTGMTTPRGAAKSYGFGLQRTTASWGAPVIYHLGGVVGFSAENAWFPAESLSLTILYNSRDHNPSNAFPTNFLLDVARAISTQGSAK